MVNFSSLVKNLKSIYYHFKTYFSRFFFKYEIMRHRPMSLIKSIQENDRQLLLIERISYFCSLCCY